MMNLKMTGKQFRVNPIVIPDEETKKQCQILDVCYKDVKIDHSAKLTMVLANGEHQEIHLPPDQIQKLIQILEDDSKGRNKPFDCSSFVHYINDIPYNFGIVERKFWEFIPLKKDTNLSIGDVILITKDNKLKEVLHFAIYIGHGQFISKLGYDGHVAVASLEGLKKGYQGKFIFQAIPQKQIIEAYKTIYKETHDSLFNQSNQE